MQQPCVSLSVMAGRSRKHSRGHVLGIHAAATVHAKGAEAALLGSRIRVMTLLQTMCSIPQMARLHTGCYLTARLHLQPDPPYD